MRPSEGEATAALGRLEAALGYRFHDESLLERALTHVSAASLGGPHASYERLEFLGDRVLGLAVATLLYRNFPDAAEGELAQRYNSLVRRETCAEVAAGLGIDAALRLGAHEVDSGGRRRSALLADACEAVLAAVYLDGGYLSAQAVIERAWAPHMRRTRRPERDPKTALQEWLQSRGLPPPVYEEAGREGPDHAPFFTIRVVGEAFEPATGAGASKREAEQNAARAVLEREGVRNRSA